MTSSPRCRHGRACSKRSDERQAASCDQVPIGIAVVLLDGADLLSIAVDDASADQVVLEVAARIAKAAAGCDEVARIGPRSFAFAIGGGPSEQARLASTAAS